MKMVYTKKVVFENLGFDTKRIRIGSEYFPVHPTYLLSLMTLVRHDRLSGVAPSRARVMKLKIAARYLTVPAVEVTSFPRGRERTAKTPSIKNLLNLCNAYIYARGGEFAKLSKKTGLDRFDNPVDILLGWVYLMTACLIDTNLNKDNYTVLLDMVRAQRFWTTITDRFTDKLAEDNTSTDPLAALSKMVFRTVTTKAFAIAERQETASFLNHLCHGAPMCVLAEDDNQTRLNQRGCLCLRQRGQMVDRIKACLDCACDERSSKTAGAHKTLEAAFNHLDRPEVVFVCEMVRQAREAKKQFGFNSLEASDYTLEEMLHSPFVDCEEMPTGCKTHGLMDEQCPDGHLKYFVERKPLDGYLSKILNKNCKCDLEEWSRKHMGRTASRNHFNGKLCYAPMATDLFRRN